MHFRNDSKKILSLSFTRRNQTWIHLNGASNEEKQRAEEKTVSGCKLQTLFINYSRVCSFFMIFSYSLTLNGAVCVSLCMQKEKHFIKRMSFNGKSSLQPQHVISAKWASNYIINFMFSLINNTAMANENYCINFIH